MSSAIGSMNNVKIFILYLMKNINYPLDYITINDIVMQTDYVMFLDFAEGFNQLLDAGLLQKIEEDGEERYTVTEKGAIVASELKSDIISSILDKSLCAALRYLDFKKRGVTLKFNITEIDEKNYQVETSFSENGKCIFSQTIVVDSLDRAQRMKDNFYERPEALYKGVLALLSGNVNYLFT
jgi:predicted transcriptional regulator